MKIALFLFSLVLVLISKELFLVLFVLFMLQIKTFIRKEIEKNAYHSSKQNQKDLQRSR